MLANEDVKRARLKWHADMKIANLSEELIFPKFS